MAKGKKIPWTFVVVVKISTTCSRLLLLFLLRVVWGGVSYSSSSVTCVHYQPRTALPMYKISPTLLLSRTDFRLSLKALLLSPLARPGWPSRLGRPLDAYPGINGGP